MENYRKIIALDFDGCVVTNKELYPITMPYLPSSKKFKVVREEFLVDPANGDYDTVAFLYLETPDGERVELNRYFKDGLGTDMISIDKKEYDERKARKVE